MAYFIGKCCCNPDVCSQPICGGREPPDYVDVTFVNVFGFEEYEGSNGIADIGPLDGYVMRRDSVIVAGQKTWNFDYPSGAPFDGGLFYDGSSPNGLYCMNQGTTHYCNLFSWSAWREDPGHHTSINYPNGERSVSGIHTCCDPVRGRMWFFGEDPADSSGLGATFNLAELYQVQDGTPVIDYCRCYPFYGSGYFGDCSELAFTWWNAALISFNCDPFEIIWEFSCTPSGGNDCTAGSGDTYFNYSHVFRLVVTEP